MNSINDEVYEWVGNKNRWFNADLELLIARGKIPDYSTLNIYGYQPLVATSFIPIWENATEYTFPSSAITMYLSSTNGDTSSILINGLDLNYAPISETLSLTGTTPVPTVKQYLRINSMQVVAGNPAGTVSLKDISGTPIFAQIAVGVGRTQAAIYTVPAGYTFFLKRVNIYTSLNGNNHVVYRNRTSNPAGLVQLTQQAPFPVSYEAVRIMPRPFVEKTDIQLQCALQSGTGAIGISQEGYLIKNTVE